MLYKKVAPFFFVFLLLCPDLRAQDLNLQQNLREQLQKEIEHINRQLSQTKNTLHNSTRVLALTQKKIRDRRNIIEALDRQIAADETALIEKTEEIRNLEQECGGLLEAYKKILSKACKNRDKELWLLYVFSSKSVGQALRRRRYFKTYTDDMQRRVQQIRDLQSRLTAEKEILAQMHEENLRSKECRELEIQSLRQEEERARKLVGKMGQQEKQLKKQLAVKKKEQEKCNREIQRLLSQTMQAGRADTALSADFAENKGRLPWPLEACVVIESFGRHTHPVLKNVQLPFNNGVNLSTLAGARVKAVFDGEVSQVVIIPGYQWCVLMRHGEYFTFYCKLGRVNIKPGEKVVAGTVLGTVAAGDEGGILHFELWKGVEKQNPENWLRPR